VAVDLVVHKIVSEAKTILFACAVAVDVVVHDTVYEVVNVTENGVVDMTICSFACDCGRRPATGVNS
jgi:hypothetical protein